MARRIVPCVRVACRACAYFRNDPADLERALAGLASFGSGYASVLGEDGLCDRHGRFSAAEGWCRDFTDRGGS